MNQKKIPMSSKMTQFYASDNLACWFTACFTEHYESLDEPDAKTFAFEVIEESEHLDKAEDFLRNCNLANDTLVDAILHSVDWDDVIERFKKAIDYWEPETRKCYKCFGIYTHETEEADKDDSGFCESCIKKMDAEEAATTICPMAPHYCDGALEGKKCPHELCDIDDCRKHSEEHNTIILKNKGLTKCDECGGIQKKTCQCSEKL